MQITSRAIFKILVTGSMKSELLIHQAHGDLATDMQGWESKRNMKDLGFVSSISFVSGRMSEELQIICIEEFVSSAK